ncbi:MAG TPA: AI-2E family transporter [Candidatus Eisenbacteria bacterium]|nr:AI-2E family transporter [Candidatus Eisenbacteria bacterium]
MNQAWLVTGFFFGLLLALLYGTFLILSPFLKAITWAGILAILVYPAYMRLVKLLRGNATAAALIVIVLITLIVAVPGARVLGFLAEEIADLVKTIRSLSNGDAGGVWQEKSWIRTLLGWWQALGVELAAFQINWRELLVKSAQVSSGAVLTQVTGVAQNILLFAGNFVIAIVTLFFFLRDGAAFCYRLRRLLPMDQDHQERLFQNIVNALTAVVHGCLVVAMIQGLLAGMAYWALGVPYAVIWGVATGFVALLPVGGTTIVSIPVVVFLFLQGETLRGILLLAWCIGVVGVVDNILKPAFIGTRLKLPVLFLFFGILGGISVFGALGLILGPVILALLAALLDLYLEEYGRDSFGQPPAGEAH